MTVRRTTPGLIEKAAARLSRGGATSLVEKAASRLASEAAKAPMPAPAKPQAESVPASQPAAPRYDAAPETAVRPQVERQQPAPVPPQAPQQPRSQAVPPVNGGPTVTHPSNAGGRAGGSNFVQIDLVKLQMNGFVTPNADRKRIIEEFRIIKRPLLNAAFATGDQKIPNGNLIMVTSARPGDGKTFTSVNLAMSLTSERDINVLLVDADVVNYHREKSVMSMLGVSERLGLLDVLNNPNMNLGEVLLRTNVPNLSLLPAGGTTLNPTELLASHRMGEVVEQLAQRYSDRVIIFDTPPVLATSEPSVLAMHVGQIVFVVEAERTSRKAVEAALPLISSCRHISLILNKADYEVGTEKFGAYYYG